MKKKAQMKLMESILVMIIFFFIIVICIGFYVKFSKPVYEKKQAESEDLIAIQASQRVYYMPELQCIKFTGKEVIPDCFDIYKMNAFAKIAVNSTRYKELLPYISILVTQVYPENSGIINKIVYNDSPNNISGIQSFNNPITLYDPINNTYGFGFVTVQRYW